MLAYGDRRLEERLADVVGTLEDRVGDATRQNDWRTVLVFAGELEQALRDAGCDEEIGRAAEEVTDLAARAFVKGDRHVADGLASAIRGTLRRIASSGDRTLAVSLPEGFAFHALYPEQFVAAARRWDLARGPGHGGTALVVGLRSIGTTLSAVVAAALRSRGWDVRRVTARPTASPYEREVSLDRADLTGADAVVLVDEGPGRSGSSLAGAAAAAVRGGADASDLAFVASHGHGPGPSASAATLAWWRRVPCFAADEHAPPLAARVRTAAARLVGDAAVLRVEDLSGSLWRATHGGSDPVTVLPPFERARFRVTLRDGRRLACRYAGIAAAPGFRESLARSELVHLTDRAAKGWAPRPLGDTDGFVLVPWVEGDPLERSDADARTIADVGRHLAQAAGPALDRAARDAAFRRLAEMLAWNARALLGNDIVATVTAIVEAARGPARSERTPSRGAGCVAPHAWIRTGDGGLAKSGATGHAPDPTLVGSQPIAWDLAAVAVEWRLAPEFVRVLVGSTRSAGAEPGPERLLRFHRAAYAGLRAGQCSLAADCTDGEESVAARRAQELYARRLRETLTGAARAAA